MIETTVVDTSSKGIDFPKLMVSKLGKIVLFFAKDTGTVMADPEAFHDIGFWSDKWTSQDFIDYEGTLRLTNKPNKN